MQNIEELEPTSGNYYNGAFLLSWCGYHINTRTLEVLPNFCRITESPIQFSITVEYTKQVSKKVVLLLQLILCFQIGAVLRRSMKNYVKSKCHAILLVRFDEVRGSG